MTPLILTAKELTAAEVRDLKRTIPHDDAAGGVTIFLPDHEEDPELPVRMYAIALDLDGTISHVGIQAAPAPRQAPTLDDLQLVAEAVLVRGMTPIAPPAGHEEASELADELCELTGREFGLLVGDLGPGLYEDLADRSTNVAAEFETWAELSAYLLGRIEVALEL